MHVSMSLDRLKKIAESPGLTLREEVTAMAMAAYNASAAVALDIDKVLTCPAAAPPPASPVLNPAKPMATRDGRRVRILCTDGLGPEPIVGYIEGSPVLQTWAADGKYLKWRAENSVTDLVNVAEKVEQIVFYNLYKNSSFTGPKFRINPHPTRERADNAATAAVRFACIEVKISATEGEGL